MFLGSNLKYLRNRKGLTQEEAAGKFNMNRSTLNNYENTSVHNPTIDLLIAFSKFYNISIDVLLKVDLTKFSENQLQDLEKGYDAYTTGTKLRVLATTVDSDNNENVELVSVKARAGYMKGYGDVEYLKKLPVFQLPFLSRERKYRTFQIGGDSMLIHENTYVIGEYVHDLNEIKNGEAYIVITLDDGIVFKLVNNQIKKNKTLLLSSLNQSYKPYEVIVNNVKEVWKFTHYISSKLPEPITTNEELISTMSKLQKEISKLHKQ